MYLPYIRGEVPRAHSKQQRIQSRPWIRPCNQRNEASNIKERITKSHWPFSVDQTIPRDTNRSDTTSLMSPIYEINKVNKPFAWTERADKAFEKIKKRLSSPPAISFPDFSRLFSFTTDVSDVVCGAILMQEADNGKKNIIAVASRTFNPMEQNWSTTEREAYAIKWAILKFDYFLRNRPFVIFTDHRSLTYLDQREFNNAKMRRWQE